MEIAVGLVGAKGRQRRNLPFDCSFDLFDYFLCFSGNFFIKFKFGYGFGNIFGNLTAFFGRQNQSANGTKGKAQCKDRKRVVKGKGLILV